MRATVVIPTRDKPERLGLTLRALRGAAVDEIVVVDDGAGPDTAEVVRQAAGQPIRMVEGRRAGRAAARNEGAEAAVGDLLIFLDDDIVVGPGFAEAHLAAQHGSGIQALTDGVAGHVVHGPLRELPAAARLVAAEPDDPHRTIADGRFGRTMVNALERLLLAMADGSASRPAPWLACVGANVSMPAALFRGCGGFDETFGTLWGCEDLECGYRLWEAGATMALAPAAAGVHLSHVRPGRWDQHQANLERFLRLHPAAEVAALPALLAADGSPARYLKALSSQSP